MLDQTTAIEIPEEALLACFQAQYDRDPEKDWRGQEDEDRLYDIKKQLEPALPVIEGSVRETAAKEFERRAESFERKADSAPSQIDARGLLGWVFAYKAAAQYLREALSGGGEECFTCGSEVAEQRCSSSKRSCGHHCNCSWTNDRCHWCGQEFGEDTATAALSGGETEATPSDLSPSMCPAKECSESPRCTSRCAVAAALSGGEEGLRERLEWVAEGWNSNPDLDPAKWEKHPEVGRWKDEPDKFVAVLLTRLADIRLQAAIALDLADRSSPGLSGGDYAEEQNSPGSVSDKAVCSRNTTREERR